MNIDKETLAKIKKVWEKEMTYTTCTTRHELDDWLRKYNEALKQNYYNTNKKEIKEIEFIDDSKAWVLNEK